MKKWTSKEFSFFINNIVNSWERISTLKSGKKETKSTHKGNPRHIIMQQKHELKYIIKSTQRGKMCNVYPVYMPSTFAIIIRKIQQAKS